MPMTKAQELACTTRGGGRLVAAAAGSGKTRVLVERLMRRVDEGADIDDFLVVTYTRAAAGELRSRILSALSERIAARPADRRLRRQTELCCRADIGTIDSICGKILRDNAHMAKIAPDFKVAEPEKADAIRAAVLDKVLDAVYETLDDHPDRRSLIDSFGAGRDDAALGELLLRLHTAVQSHPHPEDWLDAQRASLRGRPGADAGETGWGAYVLERVSAGAGFWAERMEEALQRMRQEGDAKLFKAYASSYADTAAGLRSLAAAAASHGWDDAREHSLVPFPTLGGYRGGDPLKDVVKAVRDACKKACGKWADLFSPASAELMEEMASAAPALEALLELTGQLDRAYAAEKRRQGVVDFSDQEHFVLRLLEDGSNGLAQALSRRYAEVLVDEYQDVNECQDTLFRLLSDGGKKLFMVGDVKQSIYRFRLADPTIFLRKFTSWPDAANDTPPGEPGRVLLRENFRSRPEILSAVNHVFFNIMSPALGELRYDDDSALRPGGNIPEGGPRVKMTVLTLPETDEEEETDVRPDIAALEAEYVAGQIRDMVDSGATILDNGVTRPAEYGDFAILLRSYKASAARYRAALTARGIPSVVQQGGGFFRSLEVSVLLSLLSVIDNPRQDVPLIAVLRSPVYGFTADELSAIRAADKDAEFYDALTLRAEQDERCAAFLRELEGYRALGTDLSVEALLERICETTDLPALLSSMPDGEARLENLRLLSDHARQFEQDGYRGLFRFVNWMRRLEKRGEEPHGGALEQRSAVQVISIHRSKGLEYPIVFLAGTARRFNKSDSRPAVLLHPTMGVGGKVIDVRRGIRYPTLAWRALAARLDEDTLSEEMRVLYVAMTRAKERLYITGMWRNAQKEMDKLRQGLTSPLSPELLRADLSPGCWLIRAALLPGSPIELALVSAEKTVETAVEQPESVPAEEPVPAPAVPAERPYEWAWAENLPSKITASALEGTEPPDEDAASLAPESARRASPRRPVLGEARPMTGAEKGTAAHLVMQYVDFARCGDAEGVAGEIRRLRDLGHLTAEQADAVDAGSILRFFRSDIGQRLLAAEQVWRELRFSLLSGAEEFFPVPEGEKLLFQGVVDCCIREGDALTVIDYKTDYVTPEALAAKTAEYAPQLRSYARALERILGLRVKEGVLFFLRTGQTAAVELKKNKKNSCISEIALL